MPWRECSAMEERLRFVARLLDGEAMSDVCRTFGIAEIDLFPVEADAPACGDGDGLFVEGVVELGQAGVRAR